MGKGADPEDARAFGAAAAAKLVAATEELSWLATRGYAPAAALKLVGDRHQLVARQRAAIARGACSDQDLAARLAQRRPLEGPLHVDGFNVLIGLERAMAGGPLFRGRDGALRDLAAVHGTWRRGDTTAAALARLADVLPGPAVFVLDRPVSNSGRLAADLRALGEERALDWTVEVVDQADRRLVALGGPVATGDGWLLGQLPWVDLLGTAATGAWIVDLGAVTPSLASWSR